MKHFSIYILRFEKWLIFMQNKKLLFSNLFKFPISQDFIFEKVNDIEYMENKKATTRTIPR